MSDLFYEEDLAWHRHAVRSREATDVRVVFCEACQGEGRLYVDGGRDWETGAYIDEDTGPCPYCDGTGGEVITVKPVTLDDLLEENEPGGEVTWKL